MHSRSDQQSDRSSHKQELARALQNRQLQLLAIGGTIGTGLFLGSAKIIKDVGPGLILSYAIGGTVIFFIMRALGELILHRPVAGSFITYATDLVSPFAGFVTGWSYWFSWIVTAMAQLAAIGILVHYWLPDLPQWIPALAALILVWAANLLAVRGFGELEFWLSLVKVTAILTLLLLGVGVLLLGWGELGREAQVSNLWRHDGFLPFGIGGVLLALQMVMYSYAGIELIAVSAGEAESPTETLPRATSGIIQKILFLYIGAIAMIMALVPWNGLDPNVSPFVVAFERMGIPYAGSVVNAVVISSASSACAGGVYVASRTLYALARNGQAPSFLTKLGPHQVPRAAIIISVMFTLIGVLLNYLVPDDVFIWLSSISLIGTLWTWGMIMAAHRRFRQEMSKSLTEPLPYRMPGGTPVNWLVIAFLIGLAIMLGVNPATRVALYVAPIWFGLLAFAYFLMGRRQRAAAGREMRDDACRSSE